MQALSERILSNIYTYPNNYSIASYSGVNRLFHKLYLTQYPCFTDPFTEWVGILMFARCKFICSGYLMDCTDPHGET